MSHSWTFLIATAEPALLNKPLYLENIDFPYRYDSKGNGNVVLSDDDKILSDSIKQAVFIRKHGIPLSPIGAGMDEIPFDQLDIPTRSFIEARIQEAVDEGVDGVDVARDMFFEEDPDSNLLSVTVPYLNRHIDESQSTKLAVPTVKTDDKK